MSQPIQPKSVHRMLMRTAILGAIFGGLLIGYKWLLSPKTQLDDFGAVETKGWIAAVMQTDDGNQAVIIKPDGTIMPSPGYVKGHSDRDVAWRPDGNRIFFSSDREENAYNIFRWNLSNDRVDRKTLGKINKAQPSFAPGAATTEENPLFVYGGTAWELDVSSDGKGNSIVPPGGKNKSATFEEDKAGSAGAELKIRNAKYMANKAGVVYVKRGDSSAGIWVQTDNDVIPPKETTKEKVVRTDVIDAEHVWFDTVGGAKEGSYQALCSVFNLQPPDGKEPPAAWVKNGKIAPPFKNGVFRLNLGAKAGLEPILQTQPDDKAAFGPIACSPDGTKFALVIGQKVDGDFHGFAILVGPVGAKGQEDLKPIYPQQGSTIGKDSTILGVSWAPDNKHIVFVASTTGKHDVYTCEDDGTDLKNRTQGKGNFLQAVFSPQ